MSSLSEVMVGTKIHNPDVKVKEDILHQRMKLAILECLLIILILCKWKYQKNYMGIHKNFQDDKIFYPLWSNGFVNNQE